jgi:hypothetical protein
MTPDPVLHDPRYQAALCSFQARYGEVRPVKLVIALLGPPWRALMPAYTVAGRPVRMQVMRELLEDEMRPVILAPDGRRARPGELVVVGGA